MTGLDERAAETGARVGEMMPGITRDLGDLVRIPSIAFPGYPEEPVLRMAGATRDLLARSGLADARLLEIPGGYPVVYGHIPAPPGMPTVTLYAHYDVQPPGDPSSWESDPWTPAVRDGRLYGRGAADNKSGIVMHAGTIALFGGRPPVGVRVVIEGEEETDSHLGGFVAANPDLFACDLFSIGDMGNLVAGEPAISSTLRGVCSCTVAVRTLDHPVHSGSFGGAAPDALVTLVRILSTLHDTAGNVAVPGLARPAWTGAEYPEELFRKTSGVLDDVDLAGTGPVASRVWSGPAVNVIGLDAPPVAGAPNTLIPEAAARVSLRIAPGADPDREVRLLAGHLRAVAPWHARVEIRDVRAHPGFVSRTEGPIFRAARSALAAAYGKPVRQIGGGGSIPLVDVLSRTVPGAECVLWGCSDLERSNTHGRDESVDLGDVQRMITAQALLIGMLAGQ